MSENNSLQIVIQDEQLLKEVTFNYEDLKTGLTERLKKYNDLVVTEDAIKEAKQDRANLNKLSDALAGKGTEIKKKLMGGFDVKLKELIGLVDKASKSIDTQVKSFEQVVKDQKKASIKEIYSSNIAELSDLVPFERIFNEKMLNVTASMEKVTEEIKTRIETIRKDLVVVDTLNVAPEIMTSVKDYYLRTFDLSGALSEKARLEQVKAKLAEIANKPKPEPVVVNSAPMPNIENIKPTEYIPEKTKRVEFWVEVTQAQSMLLREFLLDNKINYGSLKHNDK
jgi:hypothetical protein